MKKFVLFLLLILLLLFSGCTYNSRCNNSGFTCCDDNSDSPEYGNTPFYSQCKEKGGLYLISGSKEQMTETCQYDGCCLRSPPSAPIYDSWKSCNKLNGIFIVTSYPDRYSCDCIYMDKEYGWIEEPWGDDIPK